MSNIIKKLGNRPLAHVVECNGKYYYVDSCYAFDVHTEETMVFECDKNGNVSDWRDLHCERYENANEMESYHDYIINHLEEFIGGDK